MIYLDFETRSEVDLRKCGAWVYSLHPSTIPLCLSYAWDDGEVETWSTWEPIPPVIAAAVHSKTQRFEAHNAAFEYAIWHNVMCKPPYNWPEMPLERWVCSAAVAAAHALPRSLDEAGKVLNLPVQKDQTGKRAMMKLCKPRTPTKNNPACWFNDHEDFAVLYSYCEDDVRTERCLAQRLSPLSKAEQKVWLLDQTINNRGIRVDVESIKNAINVLETHKKKIGKQLKELTNGEVTTASQVARITKWCEDQGEPVSTLSKDHLEDMLEHTSMPDNVREVLTIRLSASKSSTAKYKKMLYCVGPNGRIRGLLMYHGASTGRWTGKLVQPQNLKRCPYNEKELDDVFNHTASYNGFVSLHPNPYETLSNSIRGVFVSSPDKQFYGGDYNAIEARVVFWLADCPLGLKQYEQGMDLYIELAKTIFNTDKITKKKRMVGKCGILQCGYRSGPDALQKMIKLQAKMDISDELAELIVHTYRETYPEVKQLWYSTEAAVVLAVDSGRAIRQGKVVWGVKNDFLFCKLPSGRLLAYYQPEIHTKEIPVPKSPEEKQWERKTGKKINLRDPGRPTYTKRMLTVMTTDSYTRKWIRKALHGGILVQNINEGVSRDIMVNGMFNAEAAGYETVLTVHDEILTEKESGNTKEFVRLMTDKPPWADGLPVKAEAWSGKRYCK